MRPRNPISLVAQAAARAPVALALLFVAWSFLCPPPAQAALIDDFATPNFDNYDDAGILAVPGYSAWFDQVVGSPKFRQDDGSALGQRDIWLKVPDHNSPRLLSSLVAVGSSDAFGYDPLLSFASQQPGAEFCIQYDGVDNESDYDYTNGLHDAEGLGGLDLRAGSSDDAFRITFGYVDAGSVSPGMMEMRILVKGNGGQTATYTTDVAENPNSFEHYVYFSDFTFSAGADVTLFDSVDSLAFHFNEGATPVPNLDFALTEISTVPEPASLLMALGVIVGLLGVRRRRGPVVA